jgi:hypothetical protein
LAKQVIKWQIEVIEFGEQGQKEEDGKEVNDDRHSQTAPVHLEKKVKEAAVDTKK